jgi:methyl-accepting chemotaxis protein
MKALASKLSFANLRISLKVVLAFTLLVAASLVSSAIIFSNLNAIETTSQQLAHTTRILNNVVNIRDALNEQVSALRGYTIHPDERYLKAYKANQSKLHASIADIERIAFTPPTIATLNRIKTLYAEFDGEGAAPQFRLASNPETHEHAVAMVKSGYLGSKIADFNEILGKFEEVQSARQVERIALQSATIGSAKTMLYIGGGMMIVISLLMGWLLVRGIGRPVVAMTGAMNKLAAGDNTVEIPAVGRKDEVGMMAAAVQSFKDAAIEKLRLEGMTAEQHKQAEEERRRNEAAKAEAAKQLAFVVDSLASGLDRVSHGDLTVRLDQPFPAEYVKLQQDFNAALEKLQDAMASIVRTTHGIKSGTGEISQAADDLSKRTEQQAASLEETAAALDEITATVRKTAEGARHANSVVVNAKSAAEESGEVVRGAVSAMNEIERSAKQISQIIGVIDEIAFQTNLLALNAGVEAARAGEAGKGFAVVASEVRALAQRSADAAKEIKGLISASTAQVDSGVELVGQTGKSLDKIVMQVGEITMIVSEIAASAQEQATGLAQVNTAVNQMDQVTQQNAAMVEQSTAASHSLAGEAQQLATLIARFQVGEVASNVEPIRKRAEPVRPAGKPSSKSAVAARPAVQGNLAVAELDLPQTREESWEEF